jgi:hypothetical protein
MGEASKVSAFLYAGREGQLAIYRAQTVKRGVAVERMDVLYDRRTKLPLCRGCDRRDCRHALLVAAMETRP